MTLRSDSDIKDDVEAELRCCPNVDETDIAVKVTAGAVTLTGHARDLFQKYGAEDAVKRVAGVVAVANDIQLHHCDWVSDPEIARAAVAAIKRQIPLCWQQVRPLVRQGSVTLEGAVDWIYQREEAEDAVRTVKGVVCVVNSIALASPAATVRSQDVKDLIAKSFQHAAELDARGITVEAHAGEVTLRGRVGSWTARRQAEWWAQSAPGVRLVRNELTVDLDSSSESRGADTH